MGRRTDKKRVDPAGEDKPASDSPFAVLAGLRDGLPRAPEADRASPTEDTDAMAQAPPAPRRAVVRFQRKGRGGKEVTLVERLDLPPEELDVWLGALKRSLGCGGVREGEVLVLQGDQRKRLPELLRLRGVGRISCS